MAESDAARAALARARAAAPQRPTTGSRRPAPPGAHRDLVGVADAVQGLVDSRGWEGPAAVAAVLGRWADIVGDDVAAHARPEEFDSDTGRLLIRADSTTWARMLGYERPALIRRLTEEVGADVVKDIVILGPAAPSWKHGVRSVRGGRGPRDTYG